MGDSFEVKGIGKVKVEPNSIQGYDYEAEGNGIIVLPERVVFTKDNIENIISSNEKRPECIGRFYFFINYELFLFI